MADLSCLQGGCLVLDVGQTFCGAVLEAGFAIGNMVFDITFHLGPPIMQGTHCHHYVIVFPSLVYELDDLLSEPVWWVNPVNTISPTYAYNLCFVHY